MRATQVGLVKTNASPYQEIHQSVRALPQNQLGAHLLAYGSVARVNPYQSLLYSAFPNKGFAVAPFHTPLSLVDLEEWTDQVDSVNFHLHWFDFVINQASDARSARTKVLGYLGRIDRFIENGGNLIWTTHNVYPHNAKFIDEELELQQGLADRAAAVHVMARSTLSAISPFTTIDPNKVVLAPHPHYGKSYEDHITRHEARSRLGISDEEKVLVLFGALKEYKGLARLMEAFQLAKSRSSFEIKLIVAGAPDGNPIVQKFVDDCLVDPDILIAPTKIQGPLAQLYLRASDLGLVTYDRTLNSGAALLYLTFGLPVLASDTPVLRESLPDSLSHFLPLTASVSEYADALIEALAAPAPSNEDFKREMQHLDPVNISEKFATDLRTKLGLKSESF